MTSRCLHLAVAALVIAPAAACHKSSHADQQTATATASAGNTAADTKPAATAAKVVDTAKPAGTPGSSLAEAAGKYTVDSTHTEVLFKIEHFGTSFQYGMFTHVDGTFTIDPKNFANSKVDLTIPTASLFTAVKKRDDDLKGPDFFDAKQFPKITFKSKTITATGPDTYSVVGALTMHGVTHDATISLKNIAAHEWPKMTGGGFHVGFDGTATINRSDWNMKFMKGPIGDQVTLMFAMEAVRNK